MTIVKEEMAQITDKKERQEYLVNSTNEWIKKQRADIGEIQDVHYKQFTYILVPLILSFIILLLRYKWISNLNECVNQAYEEKMVQEELKTRLHTQIQVKRESVLRKKYF